MIRKGVVRSLGKEVAFMKSKSRCLCGRTCHRSLPNCYLFFNAKGGSPMPIFAERLIYPKYQPSGSCGTCRKPLAYGTGKRGWGYIFAWPAYCISLKRHQRG